jgi:phosphotransferase system HPr (HPr) family protein
MADARSVLSLMILSASLGTALDIEATGNDECEAVRAVEEFFAGPDGGSNALVGEPSED